MKNKLYDAGIIAFGIGLLAFAALAFLAPTLNLQPQTWAVSAGISGSLFLGFLISRRVVRNPQGFTLFGELPVLDKMLAIVGMILVFAGVIAGCAMPLVKIGSYLLGIMMGML